MLVTLGLLILLFVVYQLWGTGIFTARAQESLKKQLNAQLAESRENDTVAPVPTTATTVEAPGPAPAAPTTSTVHYDNIRPAPPTPAEGEVEGIISIPKIGANFAYVEGTSRDDLKKGPGHYPGTPLPGTLGNAAIAGHRTTYLHPFYDVDKLKPGDDIIIHDAVGGVFDYRMTQQLIVKPTDIWVVANTPDARADTHRVQSEGLGVPAHRDQGQARPEQEHEAHEAREAEARHPRNGFSRDQSSRRPGRGTVGPDPQPRPERRVGNHHGDRRSGLVVGIPSVAAPRDLVHRSLAVRRRIVSVLRLLGTRPARRLLSSTLSVTRAQIEVAAERIRPFVHRTPVLQSRSLGEWIGAEVFVKAEHLQRIGAFKYRGATNAVQSLPAGRGAPGCRRALLG